MPDLLMVLRRPQQILRLTLLQPDRLQPLDQYDEERTVFIHDWFHTQGDVLAMSLNRRADSWPNPTPMLMSAIAWQLSTLV
jgi:hypothetical protein